MDAVMAMVQTPEGAAAYGARRRASGLDGDPRGVLAHNSAAHAPIRTG